MLRPWIETTPSDTNIPLRGSIYVGVLQGKLDLLTEAKTESEGKSEGKREKETRNKFIYQERENEMKKLEEKLDQLWESFLTRVEEINKEYVDKTEADAEAQYLWEIRYEEEYEKISAKLAAMAAR